MGASCDLRVCPRALAHIDSPVGDLNYDNAWDSGGINTLNPQNQHAGAWERHPAQVRVCGLGCESSESARGAGACTGRA
jgi:hypothetical protein